MGNSKNNYDELLENITTKPATLIKQLKKMKSPDIIDKYLDDDRINICDIISADCSPQVYKRLQERIARQGVGAISKDEAEKLANNEDCHILLYDVYSGLDEDAMKELTDLGELELINLIAAEPNVMEAMGITIDELEATEVVEAVNQIEETNSEQMDNQSQKSDDEFIISESSELSSDSFSENKTSDNKKVSQMIINKPDVDTERKIEEIKTQAQKRYDAAKEAYRELLSTTTSLSNTLKLIYDEAVSLNMNEDAIILYKSEEKESIRKDISEIDFKLRLLDEEYGDLLLAETRQIEEMYAKVKNAQEMEMQIEDTPLLNMLKKHYSEKGLPADNISKFARSYIEVSKEQLRMQREAKDIAAKNMETATKIKSGVGKTLPVDEAENMLEIIDIDNEYAKEAAEDARQYCDAVNPKKNTSLFREMGEKLFNEFAKALSTQPLSRGRLLQNQKNRNRKEISKIDLEIKQIEQKINKIKQFTYEKEVKRNKRINKIRKMFRLGGVIKAPSVTDVEKFLTKRQNRQLRRLNIREAELNFARLRILEKNLKISEKQNKLISEASWNTGNFSFDDKDKKYPKDYYLTRVTGNTYKSVVTTIGIDKDSCKELSQEQLEALSIGIDAKFPANQLKDIAIRRESPEHIGIIVMAHNLGMDYTNVNYFLKNNNNSYKELAVYLKSKMSEQIKEFSDKIEKASRNVAILEDADFDVPGEFANQMKKDKQDSKRRETEEYVR